MSIYYLNSNDFSKEGNHLVANIGGLSFVMFHSQKCTYCPKFIPEFRQLPMMMKGMNFGLCSVDEGNRIIVEWSQNSTTPIKSVPKFILYNDGIPFIEYNGPRTLQSTLSFLQDVIGKLNSKQVFTRPKRTRQQQPESPQQQPIAPATMDQSYKISPATGVKEYETSYGLPYNMTNEREFIEYENAYKQQLKK